MHLIDRHRKRGPCLLAALNLALAFLAAPVRGQTAPPFSVGGGVAANLLVGDASDFLDGAWSPFITADVSLDGRGFLGLHVDASYGGLAGDTDAISGTSAENNLLTIVGGPEIRASLGPLRPYVSALAGMTTVFWKTASANFSLENDGSGSAFTWGGHAGLGLLLGGGPHAVTLRVDGRILDSGRLPFGRTPDPNDTSQPLGVIHEDIAMLSLRFGLTVGV